MTNKNEQHSLNITIAKKVLAEQLGLEPDDIQNDDSMADDLHMRPSDITDFIQKLGNKGAQVVDLDLVEIITLNDLFETLNLEE